MAVQESAAPRPGADRRRAWIVFWVVFAASTVAPFNQSKVPPLIPVLMQDLQLSLVEAGLLMSVFSVTGLVLALPAGLLFRRFGPKRTGVLAVACVAAGSLLGALAPNGGWLLATRLLEGVGMGVSAVIAVATIAAWFSPEDRGLPIGIFSTWFPLGNFAMLLVAPLVYEAWGWRAVWIVGAIAALGCCLLFARLVDVPEPAPSPPGASGPAWHHGLLNASTWLLSLSFACFQILRVGLLTWVPTYLVQQAGMSLVAAAQVTGVNQLLSVPTTLVGAWLMTRFASRRKLYTAIWLIVFPSFALLFHMDLVWFVILYVTGGAIASIIPAAVNAAAPETARSPQETGPVVGVVAIGRNAGQVVAPALIAAALQATGTWESATVVLVATIIVGVVSGWLVRIR